MTRARVFAAMAAMLTALLLQATVVGPLALGVPASLPAVLVAAVALVDGPGTGIAFGFAGGLVADLGSTHPAGVLALCWLGVGVICGMASGHRTVRGDAALAALVCAGAAACAGLLLVGVHAGGATLSQTLRTAVPAGLLDALLALALVPLVRAFLRTEQLRAAQPVLTDLGLGPRRG